MCPLDHFELSLYLNLQRDSYLYYICHEKVKHESLLFWDKAALQSPCCGLGLHPVWIAHCVQLWLLKTTKGSHAPLPWTNMNQRQKRENVSNIIKNLWMLPARGLVPGWLSATFWWSKQTGVFVAGRVMDPWSFLLGEGRREKVGNALGPWCPCWLGSSEPRERCFKGNPEFIQL